jgi:hypothetical protein
LVASPSPSEVDACQEHYSADHPSRAEIFVEHDDAGDDARQGDQVQVDEDFVGPYARDPALPDAVGEGRGEDGEVADGGLRTREAGRKSSRGAAERVPYREALG